MTLVVYLNGEYLPYEKATVPVEDRGFVLGDGVYEMVRFFGGRPFELESHLERLAHSAKAIQLNLPPRDELRDTVLEMARRNGGGDASLYLQVTRGSYPRQHQFPSSPVRPTVLMIYRPYPRPSTEQVHRGVRCITVPDVRWQLCNIKAIGLLANVLAKQQAVDADCFEAIFVRDGTVTDGSSSNVFAVRADTLVTHPTDEHILGGVTRDVVIRLARRLAIPVREDRFGPDDLKAADEVFLTSTSCEVMPVVEIDGTAVSDGRPGTVSLRLWEAFDSSVRALVGC